MSARYAKTVVISHMKNPGDKAVKADFFMIIPDSAFISNLSMIIGGQEYVSEVKKAEEAAPEPAAEAGVATEMVEVTEAPKDEPAPEPVKEETPVEEETPAEETPAEKEAEPAE